MTPIVADMQRTARELLIVDLLLEHQRPGTTIDRAYDIVEEVLIRLGVSNHELLENLNQKED